MNMVKCIGDSKYILFIFEDVKYNLSCLIEEREFNIF